MEEHKTHVQKMERMLSFAIEQELPDEEIQEIRQKIKMAHKKIDKEPALGMLLENS